MARTKQVAPKHIPLDNSQQRKAFKSRASRKGGIKPPLKIPVTRALTKPISKKEQVYHLTIIIF